MRTFVREDHRLSITITHFAQVDRCRRIDVPAGMPIMKCRAPRPEFKKWSRGRAAGFVGNGRRSVPAGRFPRRMIACRS